MQASLCLMPLEEEQLKLKSVGSNSWERSLPWNQKQFLGIIGMLRLVEEGKETYISVVKVEGFDKV